MKPFKLPNQRGYSTLLIIAIIGILVFIILSSIFSFKDKIFNSLFPKPSSHAANIATFPGSLSSTVFMYYYSWYSAPPRSSTYGHWDGGGGFKAPNDIDSNFYPALGAYDSFNTQVINQHMKWIKSAGADALILSWWGQADPTDTNTKAVMDAAAANGLKVSFMIEPYNGRTNASIISDVKYIYSNYGNHPAFLRVSRPTISNSYNADPRGIFFLYTPPIDSTMPAAIDPIRGTSNDAILLGRMDDSWLYSDTIVSKVIAATHLDGLFNYSVTQPDSTPFPRSNDYILTYATEPGFDNSRAQPSSPTIISRQNGAFYDNLWTEMVREKPEAVSVISFNEWHEGTQIEPTTPHTYNGFTYSNFEGAYGLTGTDASTAYMNRTASWVSQYKAALKVQNAPASPSSSPAKSASPVPTATPGIQLGSSAITSPTAVRRGGQVQVTGYFGATQTISALIDIEIYNSANSRVFQYYQDNQTLPAYTTKTYSSMWLVPSNLPAGTYTVKTAVLGPGASALYQYNLNAAAITVY
jgi:glycoprotein endo-alpha-1,2-mannosidase